MLNESRGPAQRVVIVAAARSNMKKSPGPARRLAAELGYYLGHHKGLPHRLPQPPMTCGMSARRREDSPRSEGNASTDGGEWEVTPPKILNCTPRREVTVSTARPRRAGQPEEPKQRPSPSPPRGGGLRQAAADEEPPRRHPHPPAQPRGDGERRQVPGGAAQGVNRGVPAGYGEAHGGVDAGAAGLGCDGQRRHDGTCTPRCTRSVAPSRRARRTAGSTT